MRLRRSQFPCLLFCVDSGRIASTFNFFSYFLVSWWRWSLSCGCSEQSPTGSSFFQSSLWSSELSSPQPMILPSIFFPTLSSLETISQPLRMVFIQRCFLTRKILANMDCFFTTHFSVFLSWLFYVIKLGNGSDIFTVEETNKSIFESNL